MLISQDSEEVIEMLNVKNWLHGVIETSGDRVTTTNFLE